MRHSPRSPRRPLSVRTLEIARGPARAGWASALALVRAGARPVSALARAWSGLRPVQQLVLGFASYAVIGVAMLSLPWARERPVAFLDNLFSVVSALSTTGLTTVSVSDSYSFAGEMVILLLFQLGGIGYMTLTSVLVLARSGKLSDARSGILRAGFALPHYFVLHRFITQVVVFTVLCESVGALLLWWRFALLGVEHPLWSAVFHSVSAFATAGFSLSNSSLEAFAGDWVVNLVIAWLCLGGAIGFIVFQDVWYTIRLRERMITFTSKVILWTTGAVILGVSMLIFCLEPSVREMPLAERVLASAFQAMTASTTAGFNTIPVGVMAPAALVGLMIAMLIGASPSGTGGGIKTTSVSALLAIAVSVLRGRDRVLWLGHELPQARVVHAVATATIYLAGLAAGVLTLCVTEHAPFLHLVFEAASAIGTVGLSMGLTADLSEAGKLAVIALMFAGRCGPLTLGLALVRPGRPTPRVPVDDLAV